MIKSKSSFAAKMCDIKGDGPCFNKVLIANRGEIAVRILRACKEMDIRTVAVHSVADATAMHVRLADESVCIGPASAKESYLNIPAIVAACEITGADAIHPGYGFLAENANFAQIVTEHNIAFIGPSADHIEVMGNKTTAKNMAKKLGIPVVPGSDGNLSSAKEALEVAQDIGYPILIKATAGGGGRGMKVVRTKETLEELYNLAKSEALAAFGNGDVYMEKYLDHPRHIEVQVLGDTHGNAVHLGERDCSLQRRHQKLWEEAPSPALSTKERTKLFAIVSNAMQKLGYANAGTIEFMYQDGEFYFIEMNTRLQVEHPVTEAITGIDIVKEQIRIAAGLSLSFRQEDVKFQGCAIECRINAEDPFSNFRPHPGKITALHIPGGLGIRIDSGAYTNYVVPPYYDSMIGKLIVSGATRHECLMRLKRALDECVFDGIKTTIPLFQRILENKDLQNGDYDTLWLEKWLEKEIGEEK